MSKISGRGIVTRLLCLVPVLLLGGCASESMDDLKADVEEIKRISPRPIEPLPEFKAFETIVYDASELGDPFESWRSKMAKVARDEVRDSSLTPDLKRRRELLEAFPLDTLRMVGTLVREDETEVSALISSPEGVVVRVGKGAYMGQNHGRVVSVLADKVELIEIVPDGFGGWQYRPTSIALIETAE